MGPKGSSRVGILTDACWGVDQDFGERPVMHAQGYAQGARREARPGTARKARPEMPRGARRLVSFGIVFVCASMMTCVAWAQDALDLRLVQLELPGPPVEIFASDLDDDTFGDLLLVVAYTTWDQIAVSETIEDDEVEGLIEMMTVVPALADRRVIYFVKGRAEGGFTAPSAGTPVPPHIVAFVAGPSSAPILALDDEGLLAVRWEKVAESSAVGADRGSLVPRYERLIAIPSVLAGVGALLPNLPLTADLDGDGEVDLLYPLERQFDIYLGSAPGFAQPELGLQPTSTVYLPARDRLQLNDRQLHYPLPRVEDLDRDGLADLVFLHPSRRFNDPWIARNTGGGRFTPLMRSLADWKPPVETERDAVGGGVVFLGDVDGDGHAEIVAEEPLVEEEGGLRDEMKSAKMPRYRYRIYDTDELYRPRGEPRIAESLGYAFGADSASDFPLPGGFQDLNGDGRQDLVTMTLDFSMMQLVRIMVTQSISIGLDFHLWCQQDDGSFRKVTDLDLSGKFKIRLNDLKLGQLSQFAGDFDGDGRADFIQMGRGRKVSIHRGNDQCGYPTRPDLTFDLEQEPKNLSLVKVADFDGDGLADLLVVQPRGQRGRAISAAPDASTLPVFLEMHLSRRALQ